MYFEKTDKSLLQEIYDYFEPDFEISRREYIYVCYVDLTAAFDKLSRKLMWEIMKKRMGGEELINILSL